MLAARYNKRYKKVELEGRGLRAQIFKEENLEKVRIRVKTLIKLRCGNTEKANKYWLRKRNIKVFTQILILIKSHENPYQG